MKTPIFLPSETPNSKAHEVTLKGQSEVHTEKTSHSKPYEIPLKDHSYDSPYVVGHCYVELAMSADDSTRMFTIKSRNENRVPRGPDNRILYKPATSKNRPVVPRRTVHRPVRVIKYRPPKISKI